MADASQVRDCYTIAKDFAAPIATIIAAMTAAGITFFFNRAQTRIAERQSAIAMDKLKFDLFEKRYEIFSAAKELIEHVSFARQPSKVDYEKVRSLIFKLDEFRFFFGSDIQKKLKSLASLVSNFLGLMEIREINYKNDPVKWAESGDQLGKYSIEMRDIFGEMPETFENALAFKQVTSVT